MAPPLGPDPRVEWLESAAPVPYQEALEAMDARVEAISEGEASECVWLLEHPADLHGRHQRRSQ